MSLCDSWTEKTTVSSPSSLRKPNLSPALSSVFWFQDCGLLVRPSRSCGLQPFIGSQSPLRTCSSGHVSGLMSLPVLSNRSVSVQSVTSESLQLYHLCHVTCLCLTCLCLSPLCLTRSVGGSVSQLFWQQDVWLEGGCLATRWLLPPVSGPPPAAGLYDGQEGEVMWSQVRSGDLTLDYRH